MFTPRGPQRAKFKQTGINVFSLIKFLKECETELDLREEKEVSYRIAMLRQFFERDFEEGKPLKYDSKALGFYGSNYNELKEWMPRK
jgi:hypothetical protein